jgi:hypothetical protein
MSKAAPTPVEDEQHISALVTMCMHSDSHSDKENTLSWIYETLDSALRAIARHGEPDSYSHKIAQMALAAAELELINADMPRPLP